ncbi:Pectinesterase inhibitor domain [Sesbania bispinosa]|nr:Pectinesterase inhibitor domain [Sesbania bispinosa]
MDVQALTILIFILLSIAAACDDNSTNHHPQNSTTQSYVNYIKNACRSTTYPSICYKSLYPYALKIEGDPLKLCNTSLSLALKAAYRASRTISKLLEDNNLAHTTELVVEDCFDNLKESIGELRDSLVAMQHLDSDREFQMSNIKTWVSAAITDDQTCSDGFDNVMDVNVRDKIRKNVFKVGKMTSNALYFINNLTY